MGHTVHEVHTLATMVFPTHKGITGIRAVLLSRGLGNKGVTAASLPHPLRRTRECLHSLGVDLQCKADPKRVPWYTMDPTV